MIFIKKIIHTAIRQIGKTFRLTQHIPGHHNRDKRLPIHTTNSNAIRIVVNNLYGHSSESNHYLPPFASSLIMHVLTNAEKLIPRRDAASLAESRKLAGIRIVTGTTSPFTRYERISVSPASCSIRSEYVIAFYTFKLQYKCNNSTPAWEQRKLGELFEESDERASDREILSVSVANGIYPASESDRETNPGASLANYKIVHFGDVVYNSMRMWQGAVDASRYDGIVSPAYVVARPNSEVYARFFARLLRQPMLLKQYQQVSQGNSKDTQVLKFDDFASIGISMPASENEQRRIGGFFDRLDSLITLHQRKRLWFAK
jgi:hypothetical protein